MQTTQSRRRFLAGVSTLAAAGLSGSHNAAAEDVPPETTTARFSDAPGICVAPQYVTEELIIARGTDWRLFSELKRELKT